MEVKATKEVPEFHPVKLSITMETQEEFDLVYQVFNHSSAISGDVAHLVDVNYGRKIDQEKLYTIMHEAFSKLQAVK